MNVEHRPDPTPWSLSRIHRRSVLWGIACVIAGLVFGWNRSSKPDPSEWLPVNRPCSIAERRGNSVVDLYLSPNEPVKLLVSNLGHANQSSLMTVFAERLTGTPYFRPRPLHEERSRPLQLEVDESNARSLARRSPTEVARPAPSETRNFWLHVTTQSLNDRRGYAVVRSQLVATHHSVAVYADTSLQMSGKWPTSLQNSAAEIADKLQSTVLAKVRSCVGAITDVDGDGRLAVLLTPWLGRLQGGHTQVSGFVRSSDFREGLSLPFSNRADVLYLNSSVPSGSGLQTLLLHELTHAALFSHSKSRSTAGRRIEWEDWLNEGLAHLVERSAGGDWSNLDYRVARYWQQTAAAPLLVPDYYRSGRWRDHGCRGATFLFLDWCRQQYATGSHAGFITPVAAAGPAGIESIERLLGRNFYELYRSWTISLATSDSQPSQVGRFVASGPRFCDWDMYAKPQQTFEISGTASQFVELRSGNSGWYRLSFVGDSHQRWQLTLLKPAQVRPAFPIHATWDEQNSSKPRTLIVSMSKPLPREWRIDRFICEEIREARPRVRAWSAEELSPSGQVPTAARMVAQDSVALHWDHIGLDPASTVIKLRLQNSNGISAWAWCDVPPTGPTQDGHSRLADLPDGTTAATRSR